MNSIDLTNELSLFEKVCITISELGWVYECEGNTLQLLFTADDDMVVDVIACRIDVLDDKLYISTALGIKAQEKIESFKLLNYINSQKIYYGRFIIANDNSIWFDYTVDINSNEINQAVIHKAISIAVNCVCKFGNTITNVAIGKATADETILELN